MWPYKKPKAHFTSHKFFLIKPPPPPSTPSMHITIMHAWTSNCRGDKTYFEMNLWHSANQQHHYAHKDIKSWIVAFFSSSSFKAYKLPRCTTNMSKNIPYQKYYPRHSNIHALLHTFTHTLASMKSTLQTNILEVSTFPTQWTQWQHHPCLPPISTPPPWQEHRKRPYMQSRHMNTLPVLQANLVIQLILHKWHCMHTS